jgi:hypothetical protein
MVSRKRSEGQARRAKAIEKERAKKTAAAMGEYLKFMKGPRETPQLVPSLQGHVFWSNCSCRHGLDLLSDLSSEEELIKTITNEFTAILEKYSNNAVAWIDIVQTAFLTANITALELTSCGSTSGIVSFLLASGTQHLLDGNISSARDCAFIAHTYEQYIQVYVEKTRAFVNTAKMVETYLADDHTLVSVFHKRIGCSCLYEKYMKVKSIPKMGLCFNTFCSKTLLERQTTKCCSRCRVETYCSSDCQSDHWKYHKVVCDQRKSKESSAQS